MCIHLLGTWVYKESTSITQAEEAACALSILTKMLGEKAQRRTGNAYMHILSDSCLQKQLSNQRRCPGAPGGDGEQEGTLWSGQGRL